VELLPVFAHNSEKVLTICRKEGIEFARAQPGASGFVLYMLLDMAWSVEGLLDDFGDPKAVVGPADLYKSNADTVLLLKDNQRRCYWYDEPLDLHLWVSHYGEAPINRGRLRWEIRAAEDVVASDECNVSIENGYVGTVYQQSVGLPGHNDASMFTLRAELSDADGRLINTNDWSLWSFPRRSVDDLRSLGERVAATHVPESWWQRYSWHRPLSPEEPIDENTDLVFVGATLTRAVQRYLAGGGRVVVLSNGSLPEVRQTYGDLYRTVPWNTGMEGNSGTVIRNHPALAGFPCSDICDLQFVHLIKGTWPLDLDIWRPLAIDPIVRCIDHYRQGRQKAYLYEVQVGDGRLLATSFDVFTSFDETHPETLFLVDMLMRYALSDAFAPQARIEPSIFDRVLRAWDQRLVDITG
jgi:hypothetical protein